MGLHGGQNWDRPGPGDATIPKQWRVPNFIWGERPGQANPVLWEVARNGGKYRQRPIDAQGVPGSWSAGDYPDDWNWMSQGSGRGTA